MINRSRAKRTFVKNYALVQSDLFGYKNNHQIFFRIISVIQIELIRIHFEKMGLKLKP